MYHWAFTLLLVLLLLFRYEHKCKRIAVLLDPFRDVHASTVRIVAGAIFDGVSLPITPFVGLYSSSPSLAPIFTGRYSSTYLCLLHKPFAGDILFGAFRRLIRSLGDIRRVGTWYTTCPPAVISCARWIVRLVHLSYFPTTYINCWKHLDVNSYGSYEATEIDFHLFLENFNCLLQGALVTVDDGDNIWTVDYPRVHVGNAVDVIASIAAYRSILTKWRQDNFG